jgi:hypothetical protein
MAAEVAAVEAEATITATATDPRQPGELETPPPLTGGRIRSLGGVG